jgi:hypothetical protein
VLAGLPDEVLATPDGLLGAGVAEEAALLGRLAVVAGALVSTVLVLCGELGGWLVTGAAAPVSFEADEQAATRARTAHSGRARRERRSAVLIGAACFS